MPEAEFNVTYYKSVPLVPGATTQGAFQKASSVPFSLIVNDELADNQEGVGAPPASQGLSDMLFV